MQDCLSAQQNLFRRSTKISLAALSVGGGLLIMSLSGCMNSMPKQKLQLDPEHIQRLAQNQTQLLATNPALSAQAIPQDWWLLFNDPILAQLEQKLFEHNLDLQTALIKIEEAEAQWGIARAAGQPHLSVEGGYTRSTLSKNAPLAQIGANTHASSLWNLGLKSSWELDLWGYLKHLSSAAESRVAAQYYRQLDVKLSLSADLARQYLLLRGLQTQYQLLTEQTQINQRLLGIAENKFKHGVVTQEAIATAQQQCIQSQALEKQYVQQIRLLKNAVAFMLSKPPQSLDTLLQEQQHAWVAPQQIAIGLSTDFVRHRGDILQAEAELQAAVANLGAAKADFYPRIGISAHLGTQSFQVSQLGDWASSTYGIGPTLHLPIFEGGRLKRQLQLNQTHQKMAAVHYQKTVLNAWHEVDNALLDFQYNLQDSKDLQRELQQKKIIQQLRLHTFKQGTSDYADVLVVKKQLIEIQLQQSHRQTAQALSIVSLYRGLGGGGVEQWTASIQQGAQ